MIDARYVQKHDTEENWLKAINFTPLEGELIVYEPDANHSYPRYKIGDGKTNVNQLPFSNEQINENEIKTIINSLQTHSYGTERVVRKADCVTSGLNYSTCEICGEKKFIIVPRLSENGEHDIVLGEPERLPTCIEEGYYYVTCTVCDYIKTAEILINPDAHKYAQIINHNELQHWTICSGCKKEISRENHTMSSWSSISDTQESRHCTGCSYEETRDIVNDCSHPEEYRTNYHSTGGGVHWYDCTLCGNESVAFDVCDNYLEYVRVDSDNHCTKCSLCGEVFEDDLSAHVYGEPYYNLDMDYENYHYRDCIDCGYLGMFPHDYTELGAISTTGHTLACVCGGSEIIEEHYNNTDGTMICSVCGHEILD